MFLVDGAKCPLPVQPAFARRVAGIEILVVSLARFWSFSSLILANAALSLSVPDAISASASLFSLRAMARSWKTKPAYPNWTDYRDHLRQYADNVVLKRTRVSEIHQKGLASFYREHRKELEKNCCNREVNGAMALVLLRLFEEKPGRWEAVRWLNSSPPLRGATFQQYLRKWRDAVPMRHKAFVEKLAALFGVPVGSG